MKAFLCIAAIVATAHAGVIGLSTGASSQHRSEDGFGNYAFGYDEAHPSGGSFRKESGSHGVKIGSYGLRDADGRVRTVNYVADAAGFRATVSTNEPGTAPSLPAAAAYNAAPAVVAKVAAPVAVAASYAAPAYAHAALPYAAPAYAAHAYAPHAQVGVPAQFAANVFAPSGTPFQLY